MIFTMEQLKYLKAKSGDEDFIFNGQDIATDEEKKKLLELDEFNVEINGFHLIRNYEDLKK